VRPPDTFLAPSLRAAAAPQVDVSLSLEPRDSAIAITSLARTVGTTGVEMEALTAAAVAALTVYDMCKVGRRQAMAARHSPAPVPCHPSARAPAPTRARPPPRAARLRAWAILCHTRPAPFTAVCPLQHARRSPSRPASRTCSWTSKAAARAAPTLAPRARRRERAAPQLSRAAASLLWAPLCT
jgi:hypothetical protein